MLADVSGRGAAGGGDHRDDRRADGVADVDAHGEREGGNDDDAAADADQRTEEPSRERDGEDNQHEGDRRHAMVPQLAMGTS